MKIIRGAVLDLGSNSFKFMIAEQCEETLQILEDSSFVTRLAQNIAKTHQLDAKSIQKSLIVLKKIQKKIEKYHVSKIVMTGTSALRSAKNRNAFLKEAKKIIGVPVKIISGRLEGELVYQAVASDPQWRERHIVNIDIGGGSVEIVEGKYGKVFSCKSHPVGSVRLKDLFMPQLPPRKEHLTEIKKYLEKMFSKQVSQLQKKDIYLMSTGGSANILQEIISFQKKKIAKHSFSKKELEKLYNNLILKNLRQLQQIPGLPKNRASIIIPSALILLTLMGMLEQKKLYCSKRGLRFGTWVHFLSKKPFKTISHP
jgi:exopolyphosphatase/guanosine-5'-triphosphate,3'-diphosphate pyrophosphatase